MFHITNSTKPTIYSGPTGSCIHDGVDEDGHEASEWMIEFLAKTFAVSIAKEFYSSQYDYFRQEYKFCSMKCSRTCYD